MKQFCMACIVLAVLLVGACDDGGGGGGGGGEECTLLSSTRAVLDRDSLGQGRLRTRVQQIEIEAKFVAIDQDHIEHLGFEWLLNTPIGTGDGGPMGGYSDDSRDVFTDAAVVGGPAGTTYLVPANQPGNGFLPYVNASFIPWFTSVQVFVQLAAYACVAFEEADVRLSPDFPGLSNQVNLPAIDQGYGGGSLYYQLPDPAQLAWILDAIDDARNNNIISAPRVTVDSGQRTMLMVNDYDPVISEVKPEVAGKIGEVTTDPIFINTGITLDVTPHIADDGLITLEVGLGSEAASYAYSTAFNVDGVTADLQVPVVGLSRNNAVIMVNSDQTVILNGLMRAGSAELEKGLPVLGDIPYIGALFRGKEIDRTEQELVIIITPHIVDPGS